MYICLLGLCLAVRVLFLSAAMLSSLVKLYIKEQVGVGNSQECESWQWSGCHVICVQVPLPGLRYEVASVA